MILLNRLETFAADNEYFSELQFGFCKGVDFIEASFTILEKINHMLERGSKVFSCFLDVRKVFDTVGIEGLPFKLFFELGIDGRMWLVIKDLHTDVKQKHCMQGHCPGKLIFYRAQDKENLASFMHKVYINSLLKILTDHCYAISINR